MQARRQPSGTDPVHVARFRSERDKKEGRPWAPFEEPSPLEGGGGMLRTYGVQVGGVLVSPNVRSSTSIVLPAVVDDAAVCFATTLPMYTEETAFAPL